MARMPSPAAAAGGLDDGVDELLDEDEDAFAAAKQRFGGWRKQKK
jgi:hypothetical protein